MPRFHDVLNSLAVQRPRWYGATCAIAGAVAASIVWAVLPAATSRSTADATSASSTIPPSILQQLSQVESPAVIINGSIESSLFAPQFDTIADILGFRAGNSLDDTAFCPLHQRDDYRVESPDILQLEILADATLDDVSCQEISKKCLVDADGTIEPGCELGRVTVAGKTLDEIKSDLELRLEKSMDEPCVSVSVFAQNSHVYYVIPQSHEGADCIGRFAVIGNETVLDAIKRAGQAGEVHTRSVFIARPQPGCATGDLILPVNWQEVISDPTTATNYHVQSGDRIFVAENRLAAVEAAFDQIVLPFRLLLGHATPTSNENCCDGEECCTKGN